MLNLKDLRDILAGKASLEFVRSIEDAEGLELGAIAYSVIDWKYSLDDLNPIIAQKLKSMDQELVVQAEKETVGELEACVTLGEESLGEYLARSNDIKIQEGFPFHMKPLDGVNCHEAWKLPLEILEELRELGISIQNGYIINVMRKSGLCRIHNTKNYKLLTWITNEEKGGYRIQGEDVVIDKSKATTVSPWTEIIEGRYEGDINVDPMGPNGCNLIGYALLKYPHYIDRINCSWNQCDQYIELANLVYKGIIPNSPPEQVANIIPLDFLPIPSKEVVMKLDERWSYFISAWNILGDYGIENLKYTHAHLEMAYRNGLYKPEVKVNSYHRINSKEPLQEKFLFDISIPEHVFELSYESLRDVDADTLGDEVCGVDRQDIYPNKKNSFFLWGYEGLDLGTNFRNISYDLLLPEIQVMPLRPWHHIAMSREDMIREVEWIRQD